MFGRDIGIDLGTANVLIHVKGQGIVLDEPSVVAVDKMTGKTMAVGEEAFRMVGRTPRNIVPLRPMKDGVIADFDLTESMLRHFLSRINVRSTFIKPRILICCPADITSVEQKAIRETVEKSGGKHVYLEEEPKVAAIGAGMEIFQPSGNMVIDMGGGTTDVAVLSMGGIVTSKSIKTAGDQFDNDIFHYIKRHYKLLIGERTAEDLKKGVVSVSPAGRTESFDIRGRDMVSGLPRTITIHSEEINDALKESVATITQAAKLVLEQTPPELAADIIDKGAFITGGGALLHGMQELFTEELKIPVLIAEEPMHCVANGTGVMLENLDKMANKIRA
ncbi:rod shape-determining protein MreB [Salicibibacter kimchii]|uniref:Cell shape-determining protein MreB n=1 Tax=Salicibibacter kimchii TaxID=2099786 RepID=A0A345BZI3_9BACI|nr:rod shape-determining protein MreB [Salicibibacter kimchii]AXF56364.1 MreB/Mrl family cell shape determining protein [Salicibibacter kimchii]